MVFSNEKFVIGLGNPGKNYHNNRHNIGFLLINELVKKHDVKIILKNKIKSYYAEYRLNGILYRLFMPTTYMNNSGDSVKSIINWFKLDKGKLLIVVDDIDLPFGKIRVRKKGGSGGHNGLKSIINKLNTEEFTRIKIGIGAPPNIENEKRSNTISHVLGNFSKSEMLILENIFQKIIDSIEILNDKNEESIISELNSFNPFTN